MGGELTQQAVIPAATDALYMLDAAGRVTYLNPAAEQMFGWSAAECMGVTLHDRIHFERPDGRPYPMSECPLGGVLASGHPITNHEDVFIHKDGTHVPVLCSNAPIMGPDGKVQGAALVVRDLTGQRSVERSLLERAEALAESDRRKDEFIAMLAHELRNPLGAVSNAVKLLRMRQDDPVVRQKALEIIDRQVRHQARLVDDLLDMSRLTRGMITLRSARLDLAELVTQTVEDYRRDFDAAAVKLQLELPGGALWAKGDATRLSQVLGNLLSNAVKFSDRGGTVTVSLAREEGHRALLAVRDTGIGIDPGTLPRLFQPFTQADRSLDRSLGGLGLGLALVKGLVALHGGTVSARSHGLMQGAEFTVMLPIEEETVRTEQITQGNTLSTTPSRRVLIIEDNQDAADSLRDMVDLFGHQADVAYHGLKGVEAARQFSPDIILCDVGLPGLDGYGVARMLRAEPQFAETLIIAVSGYGQEEDRNRSREAGFDLHLIKPVDADELERLLAKPPTRAVKP
ncbi:MAG TPA: ATP-binding protein [Myxococcaceae bacterium]|nr:ATP-binding protein [Myxococcaceae bacterium]